MDVIRCDEENYLVWKWRPKGQAVDTTHLTDSVTMLTKEGFELKHEVFLHEAPTPEPEEVEDTTE